MIGKIKKANLKCSECGAELLVKDDFVFCQNKECMTNGKFKQVKPNGV